MNKLNVCAPCFLLVAGDPGHEYGQVVLAAALNGDAERAVPRPGELHPPQPRLHVVGVLVLPDAELLPLERDVVAAQPGQGRIILYGLGKHILNTIISYK